MTAENNALLKSYLYETDTLDGRGLYAALSAQTREGLVYPVFFGSAITGADALAKAGTVVCQPWERIEVDIPASATSAVLLVLAPCGRQPEPAVPQGESCLLRAVLPTTRLREFSRQHPTSPVGQAY